MQIGSRSAADADEEAAIKAAAAHPTNGGVIRALGACVQALQQCVDTDERAKRPEHADKANKATGKEQELEAKRGAAARLGFDPDALAFITDLLPSHFYQLEALLRAVESGALALLKGSAIVRLWREGKRIEKRQEMPLEAFWSAAELRATATALGEDYGLLFVVLSYRWLTKVRERAAAVMVCACWCG